MAGNEVRFRATLDDKVSSRLDRLRDKFDKLGGKGSSAVLFGTLAAKGFGLLDDAISSTIGFLSDAVAAAAADEASQEKLRVALENNIPAWDGNTQAIEDYASAQINRAFSDDEVRDAIGQLIGVTHDQQEAMNLVTLAEDLARAKGLDLATATDIVTKAHEGNGKALKALGIDIGNAKTGAELLDAVQKNVKGSADAWADTTQGKLAVSQAKFNEAIEKIGYTLLPVLADIMTKFSDDWLPALGRGWDKVYKAIKPVLDIIGAVIGALATAIDAIQKFIASAKNLPVMPVLPGLPMPHFAEGGWAGLNGPEMVMVGERGPEYITPNHKLGGGGGGGGGHGHDIYLDGMKVGELIDRRAAISLRRSPTRGFST